MPHEYMIPGKVPVLPFRAGSRRQDLCLPGVPGASTQLADDGSTRSDYERQRWVLHPSPRSHRDLKILTITKSPRTVIAMMTTILHR